MRKYLIKEKNVKHVTMAIEKRVKAGGSNNPFEEQQQKWMMQLQKLQVETEQFCLLNQSASDKICTETV